MEPVLFVSCKIFVPKVEARIYETQILIQHNQFTHPGFCFVKKSIFSIDEVCPQLLILPSKRVRLKMQFEDKNNNWQYTVFIEVVPLEPETTAFVNFVKLSLRQASQ